MISVICVYNNFEVFNNFINSSLEHQNVKYELIAINNTNGNFNSAAEALNYGAEKASGKYLMFVHQDVKFCSERWLEDTEKLLDKIDRLGVAGIAGRGNKHQSNVSNSKHGVPPRNIGRIEINAIEEVQTLDECLIIVCKAIFKQFHFDEKTCNGWHLYAVDLSLSLNRQGYKNIVLPFPVYHLSIGHKPTNKIKEALRLGVLPKEYYSSLLNVLDKHKDYYQKIYTTCGDWDTSKSLRVQRINIFLVLLIKLIYRSFARIYRLIIPKRQEVS